MLRFGTQSLQRLGTCDTRLQAIMHKAILYQDFAVLCGHRSQEEQDQAFAEGNSKLQWPDGKHNASPSQAIDVAPYPIDWSDAPRFGLLAGRIFQIADEMGVPLRWGGDWDRDTSTVDQTFDDWGHFEIVT